MSGFSTIIRATIAMTDAASRPPRESNKPANQSPVQIPSAISHTPISRRAVDRTVMTGQDID